MDIANMYELLKMVNDLTNATHRPYISDFVFEEDGKTVWIQLSNGNEYRFNVK